MMKNINIFFLMLFLLTISFSADLCRTKFYENITVQFVDNNYIAIPNVTAKAYYQRSTTIGKYVNGTFQPDYVETSPAKSGNDGKVSFLVANNEIDESKLDCNVIIYYTFFGNNFSYTINLKDIPTVTTIKLDAFTIPVKVFEENKAINATIVFSTNDTFFIPESGIYLTLPAKNVSGYAILRDKGVKKYFEQNITETSSLIVTFRKVNVPIIVMDDLGEGLQFNLTILNETYKVDKNGINLSLYAGTYDAIFYIENNTIKTTINTERPVSIVIDKHSPILNSLVIEKEIETDKFYAVFFISDPGINASGIASVKAYLNGIEMPVSFKGKDYKVELIDLKKSNNFVIEAYDKWGNKKVVSADIIYQPKTENVIEETKQEIDVVKTLLVIIGLAIILGVLYFIKIMYLDTS
jgi:hypothetical protein